MRQPQRKKRNRADPPLSMSCAGDDCHRGRGIPVSARQCRGIGRPPREKRKSISSIPERDGREYDRRDPPMVSSAWANARSRGSQTKKRNAQMAALSHTVREAKAISLPA